MGGELNHTQGLSYSLQRSVFTNITTPQTQNHSTVPLSINNGYLYLITREHHTTEHMFLEMITQYNLFHLNPTTIKSTIIEQVQKPASGSLIINIILMEAINTSVIDLLACKVIQVSIY